MARLHPRYIESFTPAVAAMLGVGVAWATQRPAALRAAAARGDADWRTVYVQSLLFGATAVVADRRGRRRRGAGTRVERARCALRGGAQPAAGAPASRADWSRRCGGGPRARAARSACDPAVDFAARRARQCLGHQPLGALHAGELQPLSAYLRAQQGCAPTTRPRLTRVPRWANWSYAMRARSSC